MTELKERCTRCMVAKIIIMAAGVLFAVIMVQSLMQSPNTKTAQHTSQDLSHLPTESATIISAPRLIHPFKLQDDNNHEFTEANLKDHWSILFFGFTTCPSMCPTTMAELAKTMRLLEEKHVKTMPQVVMASVDPEHDTIKAMHDYVKKFNPHFIGLTGNEQEVAKLTRELGIVYMKVENAKEQGIGQINHSGILVLVNPQGEAQAFFSYPHSAKQLAADYQTILEHAK